MSTRVFTAGLIAAALLTACIPNRDNPRDPANAPDARLRVADLTLSLERGVRECAPVSAIAQDEWPTVVDASRGRCLVLDASGTRDPHGEDELASYHFTASAGPDAVFSLGSGAEPVLSLDAWRLALPVDQLLTFEVEVRNRAGYRDRASAPMFLRNAAPIAVPDPLRVLPEGGLAWLGTGATLDVTFDGRASYDPDGDPLTYYWRLAGDDQFIAYASASQLPIHEQIPATRGRAVGELYVSDGARVSPRQRTVVAQRPQPVWARGVTGFARLDPERVDLGNAPPPEVVYFGDRALQRNGTDLELVTWPGGAIVDSAAGAAFTPFAFDRESGRAWGRLDSDFSIASWDTANDVLTPGPAGPGGSNPLFGFYGPVVDVDRSGRVWIVNLGLISTADYQAPAILSFAPGDTAFTEHTLPDIPVDFAIGGAAIRPSTLVGGGDELWVLFTLSYGDQTEGILQSYSAGGPNAGTEIIRSSELLDATLLAWIGPDDVWTVDATRGLVRIDAARLEEEGQYELVAPGAWRRAIVVDTDFEGGDWHLPEATKLDPWSGAMHFLGNSVATEVGLDGSITERESWTLAGFGIHQIDPAGVMSFRTVDGPVFAPNFHERLGLTPATGADGRVHVPFDPPSEYTGLPASRDLATGGLWVATRRDSLVHVSPDGSTREIAAFLNDGELVAPPPLGRLFASADGTHAWGVESFGPTYATPVALWYFDLASTPPAAVRVRDLVTGVGAFHDLAPSWPDGTTLYFVDGVVEGIQEITPGDDVQTVVALPGEGRPRIDIAADGGMCVATEFPGMTDLKRLVRWIPVSGAPLVLADQDVPAFGASIAGVQAIADASGPVCWMGYANPFGATTAYAFDGTQRHAYGVSNSWRATGPDDLWHIENGHAAHLTFDPSSNAILRRDDPAGTVVSFP